LADDVQYIRRKPNECNLTHVQPDNHEELCLIARSGGKIIGNMLGGTYCDWLYVKYLWVEEN